MFYISKEQNIFCNTDCYNRSILNLKKIIWFVYYATHADKFLSLQEEKVFISFYI